MGWHDHFLAKSPLSILAADFRYNSNIYSSINKVNVTSVGAVNGGICGEISGGEMKKCINYGNITNTSNYWTAGGLTGDADTTNAHNFCNISDCANYGNVSAQYLVGGLVGKAYYVTIKNCITTGNVTSLSDDERCGMLLGGPGTGYIHIENTFYNTNATLTAGNATKDIVSVGTYKTPKEFADASTGFTQQFLASGLIAYFLESKAETAGTWGQDISSSSKDAYPVLGGKKVYLDGPVSYNCQNTALNGTITNTKPAQEGTFTATPSHQLKQVAQVDPKCSETGTKAYYQCELCSKRFLDEQCVQEIVSDNELVIAATGNHTLSKVEKVEPTCTAFGKDEHYVCSVCNKMFADAAGKQERSDKDLQIDLIPHTYNVNDVCSICGANMPSLEYGTNTLNYGKTEKLDGKNGYYWKYVADKNTIAMFKLIKTTFDDTYVYLLDKDLKIISQAVFKTSGENAFSLEVTSGETYYIAIQSLRKSYLTLALATKPKNINGDGTEASPFELATANDLVWFKDYVNGKSGENTAINYACAKLTADIDLSNVCGESIGNWEPITNWYGTFDGEGHTISNLYMNGDFSNAGLFGYLLYIGNNKSVIKNIVFKNANITNHQANSRNGILAGDVRNATISNITILSGSLTGTTYYCGSIIGSGKSGTKIYSCTNHATVNAYYAGGICGGLYGTDLFSSIKNCSNYGDISGIKSGGIIGYAERIDIYNCANYGNINAYTLTNSSTYTHTGGLIGHSYYSNVWWCLTTGNVTNNNTLRYIDIVVGYNQSSSLGRIAYSSEATLNGEATDNAKYNSSECTAYTQAQMKSGEVAYKLNSEKSEGDDLAWYQAIGTDNYPVLTKKEGGIVYKVQVFDCAQNKYTDYEYRNEDSKTIHDEITGTELDAEQHIYQTGCRREACELHHYYADPNATLEAEKQSDGSFTVEQMALTDGEAYDSQAEFTAQQLSYSRNFAHDKWQALYVPFETKVTEELLNDFDLAAPNNLHEYELADGTTKVVLEAKKMKSGYTIKALRPYLIRAKEAGEKSIQLTDCPLKAATEDSYVDCSSVLRHYKFIGTLKGKNSFDTTADFVLNEGKLFGSEADTQLKAMRWYLNATDRDTDMGILPDSGDAGIGGGSSTQSSRSIDITIVDDDATTGIDDISVITEQASGSVVASRRGIYDLQGRKLTKEPQSGVYIKDGKKVVK